MKYGNQHASMGCVFALGSSVQTKTTSVNLISLRDALYLLLMSP